MEKSRLIDILEAYVPLETAEEWDNSGWQIKSENDNIAKIMLCVSVTDNVVAQAVEQNVDLIVAHHPMIMPSIKNITDQKFFELIKNDIQVYSMHTNFDKAKNGTTDSLAALLDLKEKEKLNDFLNIYELKEAKTIDDLILKIKISLNIDKLKVINYAAFKGIKIVAVCAGSGGSFIAELNSHKIDLYITSDVKYHDALEAGDYVVADVGHLESEKPALQILKVLLEKEDTEIIVANEKNVWNYI